MRWKRKKPVWPMLAALGCLFILAIAAPLNWQEVERSIPLLQERDLEIPYVVEAPEPEDLHLVAPGTTAETLPTPHNFDFGTLLEMRNVLMSAVDELQDSLPEKQNIAPQANTRRVRVSSSQDRLAMLDRPGRKQQTRKAQAPISKGPSPEDFAAELLNAAKKPELLLIEAPQVEARVAAAPVPAEPVETVISKQVEPQEKKPELQLERSVVVAQPTPAPLLIAAKPEIVEPTIEEPIINETITIEPVAEEPIALEPEVVEAAPAVVAAEPKPQPAKPKTFAPALRTRPTCLLKKLEAVASKPAPNTTWATQAELLVQQLANKSTGTRPEVQPILNQLHQLAKTGISESNPILQPEALATAQALQRRIVVWNALLDDSMNQTALATDQAPTYSETFLPLLGEVGALLTDKENGEDWRNYLLLDELASLSSEGVEEYRTLRMELAQEVLERMEHEDLTISQLNFLASEPLLRLKSELQTLAAGPVNLKLLDALLERYECSSEGRYGTAIAKLLQRMEWSSDVRLQILASQLEQYYRGANMRIAITDDLMNRMLPKQKAIVTPVQERIAGSKVKGKSRTTTQLRVRTMPDENNWKFNLEAFGKVYSNTRSETWPARVQNAAKLQFQAHKTVVISKEGMTVSKAKAKAQGRNDLVGVDSQLDPVPIVGYLLRDIARQKNREKRPAALRQVKAKVANQVRRRMDNETDPKLDKLEQKFRDKILTPVSQLALLAEPMDMYTTNERAVMNVRLANNQQLAAHTQRPFAPADSLASLQLHETVINNAITGLGLDGRRMSAVELHNYLAASFGRADITPPEDIPQRAIIEFAKNDSVQLHCKDNRLELVLSIKELAHGRDKIKNFEVHAFFRPMMKGLDVRMVRDGTLSFAARRLKTGPRVVLHSVFGKLLRKDHEVQLVRAELEEDPRLQGLMVTQLEISNGWLAVALGPAHPKRSTWRTAEQRLMSTPFVR